MQGLRKDRLSLAFQALIFQYVKREEERKAEAEMKDFKYPTAEELYALEQWAHRQRSKAVAQLIKAGFAQTKLFLRGVFSSSSAKSVQRHAGHHA
jgi:hypothetical protein